MSTVGSPLDPPLPHNRVCNLEDFVHPDLRPLILRIFSHEAERFGGAFPYGREHRKQWEIAMAVRALDEFGALRPDAELLGVGVGNEPTSFWLTRHVRRVFATDLYLEPGVWREFAHESMLTDPGSNWPGAWNPRRLVVQHMNALELAYEDASFDGVFSSGSIEHFGGHPEARRAAEEICRVLKPGGVATISTEFRLDGPAPGKPGCVMFDEAELRSLLVDGLPWLPASPLETSVSAATLGTEQSQDEIAAAYQRHFSEHGGRLEQQLLDLPRYPVIVLRWGEHRFTSVHMALVKHA